MNRYIQKLADIAKKKERNIIGLMSGTSLDGLDIALCRIANSGGKTRLKIMHFHTAEYAASFKKIIQDVFAKRTIDQQKLCGLNALIGIEHAKMINTALKHWGVANEEVDVIASHGQTVFHAPQSLTGDAQLPNSTLQIGDGDHIAVHTGIITISDFRQKHIAAGGEGAPLAAYGDYLLFSDPKETRVLLNIGGIANFTFLPMAIAQKNVFATDVGPGNTLMDQYMQQQFDLQMDKGAKIANKGVLNQALLDALLQHGFFTQPFPKTTGPELFNLEYVVRAQEVSATQNLPKADVMATLCAFSAKAIADAIHRATTGSDNVHVYMSGGGMHNPLLVQLVEMGLPNTSVSTFDDLGILPDAKEAALFAILANETLAGDAGNVDAIADAPAVCMGKVSFPL